MLYSCDPIWRGWVRDNSISGRMETTRRKDLFESHHRMIVSDMTNVRPLRIDARQTAKARLLGGSLSEKRVSQLKGAAMRAETSGANIQWIRSITVMTEMRSGRKEASICEHRTF